MSIKVIDLQNEEVKEEAPAIEPIEEAREEAPELEPTNEVVEEGNEQPKEEPKEDKPKRQTQKDKMQCPKCFKEMTVKSYRYTHEKNCQGQLSDKPVKPHINPKPKAKQQAKPKQPPKPPPEVYYTDSSSEEEVIVRRKKKQPQQPREATSVKRVPSTPSNPLTDITNHYQLLHQQMIQQKHERYNNLCKNIFAPRVKKR